MKKIFIPTLLLLFCQLAFAVVIFIKTEINVIKAYVPKIDNIIPSSQQIAFSIYGKNNLLMYRKYYKRSQRLPKDYNMARLTPLVDILIEDKYKSIKETGIVRWKMMILNYQGIDPFSLEGAALDYYTDMLLEKTQLTGLRRELLKWYTTDKLYKKYGRSELYKIFLDTPAYAENVYGIAAASKYFFNKDISNTNLLELAYLMSIMTWKGTYLDPEKDYQEIDKRAKHIITALYNKNFISKDDFNDIMASQVAFQKEEINTIEPAYVQAVLNELKHNSIISDNIGQENIDVYTGYNPKASMAAHRALEKYFKGKDKNLQAAIVLVNIHTQDVEVAIGSRQYNTLINRAVTTSRQMASTFKPIVYLAAFNKGIRPTDIIVDKPYKFYIGKYLYKPNNYEDYFMGSTLVRNGFIYSLNNATIKLAEKTGLNYIADLSIDMGMNNSIRPFYSMALGAFPATPLNVAQIYSTIANLGERKLPQLIKKIVINNETIDLLEIPRQVVSQEAAFQVLHIMGEVASKGTARGARLLTGTGAKTGTSNDIKDAWTAAIFGQYVAVSWVGYDNLKSINWGGSGGTIAAPIIAGFQQEYFPEGTTFKIHPPDNIVFKRVNKRSGKLTDKKDSSSYEEALNKNNLPEYEN